MEQINYFELEWYNRDGLDFFTISNCLNPQEMDLLAETFGELQPQFKGGKSVGSDIELNCGCESNCGNCGTPKNNAKGIFLNEANPLPQIITKVNEKYFSTLFNNSKVKELPSSVYASALNTESSSHLLTYYNQDNQEYKSHVDSSVITCIMWFHNGETNFTGGELYFPEFDIEVPPLHNTGIIFPSHIEHQVKPIQIIDKNRDSGRISYNIFCKHLG